jgi:hypothetical protein
MLPQLKTIVAVNAVSKTNGATASGLIDTMGYDWCTIDIIATTADVVSNKPTVLKIQEADDTNASNLADITAFATPASIPNANTAATAVLQNNYKFNVDLRGRKRYLSPTYSPATTQTVTIVANLGRGEQAPVTATKANAMTLVEG